MNKWLIYGFAFLVIQIVAHGQSQTDDIPPPTAPFVQFPSPNQAFTIAVTDAQGQPIKPTPPPHLKQVVGVDTVQVGSLRYDTITWDDKSQTQTWFVGRFGLVQSPQGGWVNLVDPVPNPVYRLAMPRRDATDYFSWLGLSNYVKVVSYNGRRCYQFMVGSIVKEPADVTAREPADATTNVLANILANESANANVMNVILGGDGKIAWIDVKNKLPVAVQLQGKLYSYTFRDPPTEPLVLPPKFKELVDRFQLQISVPANGH